MSTIKTKNVQVGTDGTASNNFTIYVPGTPDGTLRVGQGDAGAATDIAKVDSDGFKFTNSIQIGTDATASNNFTIYQPATPDGTLRIGVGNADSPTEVGRFNSNGYKPQKPVAFQARCNSSVTVNHATVTKLLFASEIFDTDNCYDTSNSRFTPNVAGYYLLTVRTQINSYTATAGEHFCALYKNGSDNIQRSMGVPPVNNCNTSPGGSVIVYANGSTDYFEWYTFQSSGQNKGTDSNPVTGYFEGHLIQQA